jgi:cytochrome c oxidase subunit 3
MVSELEYSGKVHPKKFSLWLLILGIVMLFAGLTSAYIVRKGDGNWYNFELPTVFLYSTIIVLLSSVSMLFAFRSAKQDEIGRINIGLIITIILGLGFVYTQFLGWQALRDEGLFFVNPKEGNKISASFLIVLAGVHLVHIIAGVFYLLYTLVNSLKLKIHKKATLLIEMCNTYWHFVGLLWVYLYLFLYFAPGF